MLHFSPRSCGKWSDEYRKINNCFILQNASKSTPIILGSSQNMTRTSYTQTFMIVDAVSFCVNYFKALRLKFIVFNDAVHFC